MSISKPKVYSGILSNIETRAVDGQTVLIADLTKVIQGETVVTTVVAADGPLRDLFVEGANVRLYGVRALGERGPGENPNRFVAIGPDLTRRTLSKANEAALREAQTRNGRSKGPMSPAQKAAWESFRATYRTPKAARPVETV